MDNRGTGVGGAAEFGVDDHPQTNSGDAHQCCTRNLYSASGMRKPVRAFASCQTPR